MKLFLSIIFIVFSVSCDKDINTINPYSDDMVDVPAGFFWMGCNESTDDQCESDEYPYHEVFLSAYKIDKYEVTVSQYQACVDEGACIATAEGPICNLGSTKNNHPVTCITWYEAKAYCEWIGKRLPTEAEWEKAARGTDGRKFPWGNETPSCDYSVMDDLTGGDGCGTGIPMPVGSKPAGVSPYGAYDMAGNVGEWCNDSYSLYSSSEDPEDTESLTNKVIRGGSWYQTGKNMRSSNRSSLNPENTGSLDGFRCAK